ncbi:DUF2933 domain-containing protein [Natronogracilivirgula saccharolytica]|uniref:Uncharacterized protein n=1 Tax=Natronogracilivirga saccharolytica TaxID=2812953 RepID=A0A8J7RUB6_9BACT|nr:hypothetical protein [Natronogracilivirga saccharolytica]
MLIIIECPVMYLFMQHGAGYCHE